MADGKCRCILCDERFYRPAEDERVIPAMIPVSGWWKDDPVAVCPACRAKAEGYDALLRISAGHEDRRIEEDHATELEAKLAAQATHAAIGRAVERMPDGIGILRRFGQFSVVDMERVMNVSGQQPTPLDAFKAAGLCDEEVPRE